MTHVCTTGLMGWTLDSGRMLDVSKNTLRLFLTMIYCMTLMTQTFIRPSYKLIRFNCLTFAY